MGGYGAPGGFNQMPPQSSSKKGLFIGLGIGVLALSCGVVMVLAKQAHDKEQATYGALKTVCSGQGVPGARMYTPTGLPHRVVGIARSTAGGEWSVRQSLIPVGRRSPDVAGTDIVMCFEPVVEQQQGTCDTWRTRNGIRVPGSTRNFPRVQLFQPVRLVSAQTGVTLNQGTLVGGAPANCNVTFGSPSASSFRGSAPDDDEVNTYLAPLLGN
jgi:hypothetical protein